MANSYLCENPGVRNLVITSKRSLYLCANRFHKIEFRKLSVSSSLKSDSCVRDSNLSCKYIVLL